MGLLEDLRHLSDQVNKRLPHIRGEEATKQALILPFLQVLGFDVYDPIEVQPEFNADFPGKKPGPSEKVDYAVHLEGKVAMLIECKAVDSTLPDHDGQLSRYFNAIQSCKLGLLTNGLAFRFFTDLRATNIMDTSPFYVFDIRNFNERDVEALRPLTKTAFNPTAVQIHAEDLIFVAEITRNMNSLLRNPSENFVRFLVKEAQLAPGGVTQKVVDRFLPIVKKAIQTTILELMASSIQQELAQPHREAAQAVVSAPEPQPEPSPAKPKAEAETTEEELQMFELIRTICSESRFKREISYADSLNYLAVQFQPDGKKWQQWFARLVSNSKSKVLATPVPLQQALELTSGFKAEEAPKGLGASRVYFDAPSDLVKLRSLLIAAFEGEVQRVEGAGLHGPVTTESVPVSTTPAAPAIAPN